MRTIYNSVAQRHAIAEIVAQHNPKFALEYIESKMAEAAADCIKEIESGECTEYNIGTMGWRVEASVLSDTLARVDYLIEGSVLFSHLNEYN